MNYLLGGATYLSLNQHYTIAGNLYLGDISLNIAVVDRSLRRTRPLLSTTTPAATPHSDSREMLRAKTLYAAPLHAVLGWRHSTIAGARRAFRQTWRGRR